MVLITNFKIKESNILVAGNGPLGSLLVKIRQTAEVASESGNNITFSTGYGKPVMVWIQLASNLATYPYAFNVSIAGSIVYVSLIGSASFGSLAATISIPVNLLCLIGSR